MEQKLRNGEMIKGYWEAKEILSSYPQSRESPKMCVVGKRIYLFGGFAREPFNDTRIITELDGNYGNYTCQVLENKGEEGIDYP